ncbi:bifunctional hydroxymethylpyrimidine kinase/phosphomethylpyrimidine kinase [Paenibacillus sp. GCM10023252]|uniref:bifunctional hydroxymethylpyrimidine kinase/phosphomethylpyrimidine kinase n=1 Tax=Paenibacillus sp. GCM10023252 TaxID=3252649 RepID=UPI003622EB03
MNVANAKSSRPRVLTIAGSDSGGGAGIQADLKTWQELEVFGMSAITAVTAQNSLGVQDVHAIPVPIITSQLEAVLSDIGADAVKTGMLHSAEAAAAAAAAMRKYKVEQLVLDPVLTAKNGHRLLAEEALQALKGELIPLAQVMTPNIPEACVLLNIREEEIRTTNDMVDAARCLLAIGSRWVLLKGGHLPQRTGGEEEAVDVLLASTPHAEPILLRSPRIPTRHTHGTGCTLAAAIAAYLARGCSVPEAAGAAKLFTLRAIEQSFALGAGIGPLWHAAHRASNDASNLHAAPRPS